MHTTVKIAKKAISKLVIVLLMLPSLALAHQEVDVLGVFILGTIIGKELARTPTMPPKIIILPKQPTVTYTKELEPVYEIVTEYSRGCDCFVTSRRQIGWK